ncbi:MAG: biotin transporter BioY, partial [Bacteroidota bacterium]
MHRYIRIAIAILFISAAAQVSFDLPLGNGIPITGQTFAVFIIGYLLGIRDAVFSILIYLFLGILGLPVYADGSSGIEVVQSGSGGFLIGFVAAAYISAKLAE